MSRISGTNDIWPVFKRNWEIRQKQIVCKWLLFLKWMLQQNCTIGLLYCVMPSYSKSSRLVD